MNKLSSLSISERDSKKYFCITSSDIIDAISNLTFNRLSNGNLCCVLQKPLVQVLIVSCEDEFDNVVIKHYQHQTPNGRIENRFVLIPIPVFIHDEDSIEVDSAGMFSLFCDRVNFSNSCPTFLAIERSLTNE